MRGIVRLLAGVLVAWLPLAAAAAQSGVIRGTVTDSAGGGLANATVSVEGTGLRAATGSSGEYEVRGVAPGTYTVRVRLVGFRPGAVQVTVAAGAGRYFPCASRLKTATSNGPGATRPPTPTMTSSGSAAKALPPRPAAQRTKTRSAACARGRREVALGCGSAKGPVVTSARPSS